MEKGAVVSMSRKQKMNTKSITEAKLPDADYAPSIILLPRLFLESQGYKLKKSSINIIKVLSCYSKMAKIV